LKKYNLQFAMFIVVLLSCTVQKAVTKTATENELPIAFTGAEGFGKYNTGGTAYEATLSACPALQSLTAPTDANKDGIPDEWEKKHGLNPNKAEDAPQLTLHKYYTNIEVYIKSITP
jgi:hypothetical protein